MPNCQPSIISYRILKTVLLICFTSYTSIAQTEFFNSKIEFSEKDLNHFYSSFSLDNTQIYFNANDYSIRAYDKKTGNQNWSYYSGKKSNKPPRQNHNSLFVGKYLGNENSKCVELDTKTGSETQILSIGPLETEPVFKGDLMYCTALYNFGNILAYDLKKNSVLWYKFIAHGVGEQPYYLKDKIVANAEGDNWIELDYKGNLLDTICKNKITLDTSEVCVKNFRYLSHNQKEITESVFPKQFSDSDLKIKHTQDLTFILEENKILVIGNNGKVKKEIRNDKIISPAETSANPYREILKIQDTTLWLLYGNILAVYDFKKNKTLQTYDLSSWNAHQAVLEDNNIWLISTNDGQLYGIKLDK